MDMMRRTSGDDGSLSPQFAGALVLFRKLDPSFSIHILTYLGEERLSILVPLLELGELGIWLHINISSG